MARWATGRQGVDGGGSWAKGTGQLSGPSLQLSCKSEIISEQKVSFSVSIWGLGVKGSPERRWDGVRKTSLGLFFWGHPAEGQWQEKGFGDAGQGEGGSSLGKGWVCSLSSWRSFCHWLKSIQSAPIQLLFCEHLLGAKCRPEDQRYPYLCSQPRWPLTYTTLVEITPITSGNDLEWVCARACVCVCARAYLVLHLGWALWDHGVSFAYYYILNACLTVGAQ